MYNSYTSVENQNPRETKRLEAEGVIFPDFIDLLECQPGEYLYFRTFGNREYLIVITRDIKVNYNRHGNIIRGAMISSNKDSLSEPGSDCLDSGALIKPTDQCISRWIALGYPFETFTRAIAEFGIEYHRKMRTDTVIGIKYHKLHP